MLKCKSICRPTAASLIFKIYSWHAALQAVFKYRKQWYKHQGTTVLHYKGKTADNFIPFSTPLLKLVCLHKLVCQTSIRQLNTYELHLQRTIQIKFIMLLPLNPSLHQEREVSHLHQATQVQTSCAQSLSMCITLWRALVCSTA